jgi:site-specific DNA-methyltransferase (adenine-specific)
MGFREEIIGDCRLILGDCRDFLPTLADNSIDMLWTDPPYGHSNHDGDFNARLNEHRDIKSAPIANDDMASMRSVVDFALTEAARFLNKDCCCCCCCCGGGGPKPTFAWLAARMDTAGLAFFHSVIWDKSNPGLGWRYRRQHEMVMVAHRTKGKLLWASNDRAVPNIFKLMPPREREHPNEKPGALVDWFIGNHSTAEQTVIEPFMGSGTTGVSCVNMGRKFIGVELDPKWFEVAVRRVSLAHKQPRLFKDEQPKPVQDSMLVG